MHLEYQYYFCHIPLYYHNYCVFYFMSGVNFGLVYFLQRCLGFSPNLSHQVGYYFN